MRIPLMLVAGILKRSTLFKNKLLFNSFTGRGCLFSMLQMQMHHRRRVNSCMQEVVIPLSQMIIMPMLHSDPAQNARVFSNQLDIVNLNVTNNNGNPMLEKTYPMKNPHGLSKDGDLLFICDGAAGLKLYNAGNVSNLQLIHEISDIETFDVITMNKIALVVAKDGLYQYSYADISNIRLLSKITKGK